MSTFNEIKNIPKKFIEHRDELILLFKEYEIDGIKKLISVYKTNKYFLEKWNTIWINLAEKDGGKLSLTTVGIIIGSALGGVGIAAMGSAIGMPLALILGLGGLLTGSKVDSLNFFSNKKSITIQLSKKVFKQIELDSKIMDISVNELIEKLINNTYSIKA